MVCQQKKFFFFHVYILLLVCFYFSRLPNGLGKLSSIFLSHINITALYVLSTQLLHGFNRHATPTSVHEEFRCKNWQTPFLVKLKQVYYAIDDGASVLVKKQNSCKIWDILLIIRLIQSVLFQKLAYPVSAFLQKLTSPHSQPGQCISWRHHNGCSPGLLC